MTQWNVPSVGSVNNSELVLRRGNVSLQGTIKEQNWGVDKRHLIQLGKMILVTYYVIIYLVHRATESIEAAVLLLIKQFNQVVKLQLLLKYVFASNFNSVILCMCLRFADKMLLVLFTTPYLRRECVHFCSLEQARIAIFPAFPP